MRTVPGTQAQLIEEETLEEERDTLVIQEQIIQRSSTLPIILQSASEPEERSSLVLPSTNLALLLPLEAAPEDSATWIGIRIAYVMNIIHQWSSQAMSFPRVIAVEGGQVRANPPVCSPHRLIDGEDQPKLTSHLAPHIAEDRKGQFLLFYR